jgi:hypothetical protein
LSPRSPRRLPPRSLALAAVLSLAALAVPACSKSPSTSEPQATTVFVQQFRYHGMPSTMPSGIHEFVFENKESFNITHEMIPVALPAGKSAQDIIADAKSKGADSEDEWLHIGGDFGPADTGASVVEWLYLPPGNYAVACWQTGVPNNTSKEGPPHAAKGMVFGFKVT